MHNLLIILLGILKRNIVTIFLGKINFKKIHFRKRIYIKNSNRPAVVLYMHTTTPIGEKLITILFVTDNF
jgi:hypothetical protein